MMSFLDFKDLFWFMAGLIVPPVFLFIRKQIKKYRSRKAVKKYGLSTDYKEICSLAHGDPYYEMSQVVFAQDGDALYFEIPKEYKKKLREMNPEFEHVKWEGRKPYFKYRNYQNFLEDLASRTSVEEKKIDQYIQEARISVAEQFLTKVDKIFNNPKYGISQIIDQRIGKDEEPSLLIHTFETDYYTHKVMSAVYQKLVENEHLSSPETIESLNRIYPFITSIGVDMLLVIQNDDPQIVLVKRSGELLGMQGDQWHVSMNEGVSLTDLESEKKRVSLSACVNKGLREELGIENESYGNMQQRIYDFIYLKDVIEPGFTGLIKIDDLRIDEIRQFYQTAKDKELEGVELITIPCNQVAIRNFILKHENEITEICRYSLQMLRARMLRGDI